MGARSLTIVTFVRHTGAWEGELSERFSPG